MHGGYIAECGPPTDHSRARPGRTVGKSGALVFGDTLGYVNQWLEWRRFALYAPMVPLRFLGDLQAFTTPCVWQARWSLARLTLAICFAPLDAGWLCQR